MFSSIPYHGNGSARANEPRFVAGILFMTLTLINKCILNPFNVLYFITFKFIYFFTLQYAFVLIQFYGLYFKTRVSSDEHRLEPDDKNFKMTCHGLFSCDVKAISRILFIVPDAKSF